MNEDLEIIKGTTQRLNSYLAISDCDKPYYDDLNAIDIIVERMAAEIERLENENSKLKTAVTASGFLYDAEGDLQEALFECAISNDNLRAEIARLKAEVAEHEKWYKLNHEAHVQLMDRYNGALADITALKAEVEKRPEVVRCGECKNYEWEDDESNVVGHVCELTGDSKNGDDFCSQGQRRESEEGK